MVDPCRRGLDVLDILRFRPRNWIMLDEEPDDDDNIHLFINVVTGRVIHQSVPMLRNHVLVASSDGLLVLADTKYPHAGGILNPFTGWFLRFTAAIPRVHRVRAAVAGSDDNTLLVFSFFHDPYDDAVSCAHPTASELLPVAFPHAAGPLLFSQPASMVTYQGHVYVADREGPIVKLVFRDALITNTVSSPEFAGGRRGRAFLVVSGGELLLVWRQRAVEVFRVDVGRRSLEPLRSIGRRALFLGDRCLSVDASKLPSVDGNCVYLVNGSGKGVWRYDLGDGSETMISSFRDRPFGMVQALLSYGVVLPDAKAQLHSIYRTGTPLGE
ncbi:hypothetical protein ACQ4PT_016046 [Festuca glaucescens]